MIKLNGHPKQSCYRYSTQNGKDNSILRCINYGGVLRNGIVTCMGYRKRIKEVSYRLSC